MKGMEDKSKPGQSKHTMALGGGKTKFKKIENFKANQTETYIQAPTAEDVAKLSKFAEEIKPQGGIEMAILTDEAEAEEVADFELSQVRTILEQVQQQTQTTLQEEGTKEPLFNLPLFKGKDFEISKEVEVSKPPFLGMRELG